MLDNGFVLANNQNEVSIFKTNPKKTPTVPKKSNGGLVSRPGNATEVEEIIEVTGVKEVMT